MRQGFLSDIGLCLLSLCLLSMSGFAQSVESVASPATIDSLLLRAFQLKTSAPQEGEALARRALRLAEAVDYPRGLADADHTLGMLAWYQGNYSVALEQYLKALALRREIGDSLGLARSYQNVGLLYDLQREDSIAIGYFRRARQMREVVGDEIGVVYSMVSIAEVLEQRGDTIAAKRMLGEARTLAMQLDHPASIAFTSQHLAQLYLHLEDWQRAEALFRQALQIRDHMDGLHGIASNTIGLAKVALGRKNWSEAVALAHEQLPIIEQLQALPLRREAHRVLADAYRGLGRYADAERYLRAHLADEKALSDAEQTRQMALTRARFEADQKDQELQLLREQSKNYRLRITILLTVIISLALVAGIVIVFLLYRSQNRVNRLLTEQKAQMEEKNRQLAAINTELADFAHAASHDLKQPLRTIGSYSSLLERRYLTLLGESGRDFLQFITQGVDRMWQLLNDLLYYAEFGKNAGPPAKVDLDEVLAEVQDQLRDQIQQNQAQISVDPLPTLMGYRSSLVQLFQNLISNAIKFRSEAPPCIHLHFSQTSDHYRFAVVDNGIGIDPAYQTQIFQAFKRLNGPEVFEGSGLGLAIVMKAVQQHRGKVWVEANREQGSTFTVEIPR